MVLGGVQGDLRHDRRQRDYGGHMVITAPSGEGNIRKSQLKRKRNHGAVVTDINKKGDARREKGDTK